MADDTDEVVGAPNAPSSKGVYDPDRTRLFLAVGFSATYLAIVLAMSFKVVFGSFDKDMLTNVSSSVLSPLGALLGSIVGFYFASKK
jgi:hypothetical protein